MTLAPVISANVLFSLYRDLTFMLRSWLSLYLLMDIISCVIVTLLNDNWCFLINGHGLFVLGGEVIFIGVMTAGCWLELVERWLLLGGL